MPDDLFLIDGNSLAYRAFFALPESIATSTGFPTNAIFGFASMLVKIMTEHGQKPTVVVWDAGHSGRKEVYPDYKAQRTSRPSLLKQQWPHLEEIVDAFGYANVRVEGFEADDVIASIAEKARHAEPPVPVTIVTGDRDAFQLIDDDGLVTIMATARGITDTKSYDRQAVIDRYGIPPELIPDFYGLKGDTSDNIPGVPGIGDKTAATLLQQFGDLETVLASIDEISGAKRKENLTNHAQDARISRDLARMNRQVEVDLDPTEAAAREPDRSRLREVFREFELRDPLRRLEEALGSSEEAAPAAPTESQVGAVVREATLEDVTALPAGAEVAIAVHAPEVAEGELFAAEPTWRFGVFPTADDARDVLVGEAARPEDLVAALGDRPVVAHDAKELGLVPPGLALDTMLAAYLLEPARRGYPFAELCEERGFGTAVEDPAGAAAVLCAALAGWQREQLADRGLQGLMDEIELPLVDVLRAMEVAGVKLDKPRLAAIRERVHDEIVALEREVWELAGEEFVLGSPQQLGQILFEKLGLSRKRRGKTGFSTDARVLQAIRDEHPVVPKIERWRELNQLAKTYLDVLPNLTDEESRIHTTFLQAVAQTGRLSSTNPNMQNVPVRTELGREIRGCFEAAEGMVLLSADYEQVELRVLAHAAGEQVLKDIFLRGEDVHTATASQVFGKPAEELTPMDRSKAKMINYGIVYGLSDYGLADRLNIPREEAKEFIDTYLERFPAVHAFMTGTIEQATDQGHVTTLYGRRRQIPELKARNYQVRTLGERLAVNTVIQGTAADVIKLAMIGAHRALREEGLTTRLILQIHDELLFEGPPEEMDRVRELAIREMVAPWPHDPPMAVAPGVGTTWLDAK
ncbi:DNA polymerase I [Paraconexibacter algicola]|uniref:DNA polymerase I n=1 Tax=Paraconexibacter algicola TaxID=2133960 RepID=A0A2T4UEL2_9ACTN|nr:DNA polymerase I [Paraconexibacter algicola]PTL56224.1 DNA polymerase I [Paraconexibacter algicola]